MRDENVRPAPPMNDEIATSQESPPMNRRTFLGRLPVIPATAVTVCTSLGSTGCATVPYVVGREGPGRIRVGLGSLGGGEALVESAQAPAPIYVRRGAEGRYTALLLRCTHRGCEPEPSADRLECPCHGSEFDFEGRVLQGPASRPLTRYRASEEGADLVILLEAP